MQLPTSSHLQGYEVDSGRSICLQTCLAWAVVAAAESVAMRTGLACMGPDTPLADCCMPTLLHGQSLGLQYAAQSFCHNEHPKIPNCMYGNKLRRPMFARWLGLPVTSLHALGNAGMSRRAYACQTSSYLQLPIIFGQ